MAKSSGRRRRGTHVGRVAGGMLASLILVWTAVPAAARPMARAAHTLNASDTGKLHLLRASGSLLYEEGAASGGIPGRMKADMNIGATFTSSFTIYTTHGTVKGHGSATPRGAGRYESFSGSVVITGGSGRYAHAHGNAGLYGTFDRKTYAFVVQTTGKISY